MTRTHSKVAVPAVLVGALLLASCGGTDASTDSTTPAAAQGSGSAGVEQARADVADTEGEITDWPEVPKLSRTPDLKGKTVWWVPFGDAVAVINAVGSGMTEALESAGAKVKTCDGQFNPTEVASCLKSAGDQGADAVVTGFVDYAMIPNAFDALVDKGVPVLVAGVPPTGERAADQSFAFFDPSDRVRQSYEMMSKLALDAGGDDTNVLWLQLKDSSVTTTASEQGVALFEELCPDCGVATVDFTTPDIDKLPSNVSAALVSNPKTNVVVVPVDSFVPPAVAGIASAGFANKVQVVSSFGDVAGLQRVQAGQQYADSGTSTVFEGWMFANALMQLLAGDTVQPQSDFVTRSFKEDNVKGLELTPGAYKSTDWYGDDSFKDQFRAAWGLS
jgi:ribose transport system substrate-binding protein